MLKLDQDGEVYVLNLAADGENRLSPAWLGEVEAALDQVEAAQSPCALVTVGSGKFWSTGLDLDWLGAHLDEAAAYLDRVSLLLARTLASPVVTVAALNGHAFGAGGMWALAHDFRVMRADRGYFCLPEVDLGLDFEPRMSALVRSRLTPATAHEAMTTGRRYGGPDALAAGIVEQTATAEDLTAVAVARAREFAAKTKPVRGKIKETLYAETLAALRTPNTAGA
jgi:enoyl-CoA hydratase/carnithine racemase